MQGRNIWIVLAAIAIGLVAVVIANSWFTGVQRQQEKVVEQQKLVSIVVATQPMEFGTKITPQMIRLQAWPANSVPQGAFTALGDVLKDNRVALRPIVPNEPVLAGKVSGTDGRATLAAVLPKGMSAYTIPIDAVRGVAGFVLPGTMVDILLTRAIEGSTTGALRSDVILRNVQVMAVNQLANDKEDKPAVSQTATLAVTVYDAQRLSIAQQMGTMSLVLRKVEDAAGGPDAPMAGPALTVTNRNVAGGPIFYARRGPPPAAIQAPRAAAPRQARGAVSPGTGAVMTVVRGVEPTIYPLTVAARN